MAVIGVAGALGGIAVGWILQDRRRHEESKRQAFARFVGVSKASINLTADALAGKLPSDDRVDAMARELWETLAMILILGNDETAKSARAVQEALRDWLGQGSKGIKDTAASDRARGKSEVALEEFLKSARRELD